MAHTVQTSDQWAASGTRSSPRQPGVAHDKVYHTVTACRKTRCDTGLPRCRPCERNSARCEYFDASKNRAISRAYITSLQSNIKQLQGELIALEGEASHVPNAEDMMRGAGMIKFNEDDEYRFLGPSSGIAITRLVMDLAKQNTVNKSIREIVPDITAHEIKQKFVVESGKPTSKVYPQISSVALTSSVAAPQLPTQELTDKLIDLYMVTAQYMLPLLHEPSFRQDVLSIYDEAAEPTLNFQLRLVIAISMQKLNTQYAGLADSYYLAALPYLESAVRKKDLSTLQCLALIAQYSLLTPTRTASYWVVGLAARLCQELGLCAEQTIKEWPEGTRLNMLEVDMRRRLFWIITSMEYGLAHSLGRPSAFGITVDHIDVGFFELCDDRYITPSGLLDGHQPVMKKCISVHFFRMRLLQAEIRRTLYLKKRCSPVNDRDPWFSNMQGKLDEWVATCPKNDEGSGLSESWFHAKRNTMIVFLYRPSPQVPEPSEWAAEKCYDAAVRNVNMQKSQISYKSVDLTWIFTQSLFMALNTILWSLSYPSIRRQHPIEQVRTHLQTALEAIDHTSERWPGVQSAVQLYQNLIQGCLKAYSSNASYVVRSSPSPQDEANVSSRAASSSSASPLPPALAASRPSQTQPEPPDDFLMGRQSPACSPSDSNDSVINWSSLRGLQHLPEVRQPREQDASDPWRSSFQEPSALSVPSNTDFPQSGLPIAETYGMPNFNPHSVTNDFPPTIPGFPCWDPNLASSSFESTSAVNADLGVDTRPWLGSFGEEYSQYMHQAYWPPREQMQSLSEQQQLELMATLEQDQLPDVSNLASDAATFYTANTF